MKNFLNEDDYKIEIDDDAEGNTGLIEDKELLKELGAKNVVDGSDGPNADKNKVASKEKEEEEDDDDEEEEAYMSLNDYGTTDIDDLSGDYSELADYEREDYWVENREGYDGLDIDDLG